MALTGIMGAGKSTVGALLHKKGFHVVSADQLARLAIFPHTFGWHQLVQLLGVQYLKQDGYFDRARIADLVFREPEMLKKIEDIIHPIIWDLIKKKEYAADQSGVKIIFFEIPLLFEKNLDRFFDISLLIAVDQDKQRDRLHKNKGLSTVNILSRMQFQIPQQEKIKKADYVIWNNSSLKDLENQISEFLKNTKLDLL